MEEEKKNRISEWISGHKKQMYVIAACAAAALIVLVIFLVSIFRTYSSYETVSSYTHSRESNDQYIRFCGNIVQYGGDGITCLDSSGSSLWSKSYEMEQPVLAAANDYLAVGDQGGGSIYLFDEAGFLTQIETPYPVRQLAVADNGYTAAVLEESDACRLMLYDANGDVIVEGQAHLDDSGYPAAIALSADGTTLAVSYLQISSGELSTELTFYDFSNTESGTAQSEASYTYAGEMIVRLAVIGGNFAAFSGTYARVFTGGSLSLRREIAYSGEAESIVIGTDRFGIVCAAQTESESADASGDELIQSEEAQDLWELDVYGKSGSRIAHAEFEGDYQDIVFLENGSTAVLGTDSCRIISPLGLTRFSGMFDSSICGIFSNGMSGYILIFSDRIERVRLQ